MKSASNKSRILFCVIAGAVLAIGAGSSVASVGANASRTSGAASRPITAARAPRPRPDEVTGEVTLTQSGSDTAPDASQVVVWLTPSGSTTIAQGGADKPRYRLVQHNKRFAPSLLVVLVGSVVEFPNQDPWFHNVFSLYRGKRFDLGLYQAGAQRSVHFDRIGPLYLFCNIHPEMTGVVLAVDSKLFSISDKAGRYAIDGVAPGKY